MKVWPRKPNPAAAARIAAHGVRTIPAEAAPTPAPASAAPCGFCGHDRDGHGVRYSTFGGSHEWVRRHPGSHSTSLHPLPIGDPR